LLDHISNPIVQVRPEVIIKINIEKFLAAQKIEKEKNKAATAPKEPIVPKVHPNKEYTAKQLHYQFARFDNTTRTHAFTADTSSFQKIKKELCDLKGDALKTKILTDFKASLEGVLTENELKDKVLNFKKTDEYKILETGQGRTTRFLALQTSSAKAVEDIIADQKVIIADTGMGKNIG